MTTPGATPGGTPGGIGGGGGTPGTPGTPGGPGRGGTPGTPGPGATFPSTPGRAPGGTPGAAPGGTPGLNTGNFTAPGDITGLGFGGVAQGGGTPGGGLGSGGYGFGGGAPGNITGLGLGSSGGYGTYGAGGAGGLGALAAQAMGGAGAGFTGLPGNAGLPDPSMIGGTAYSPGLTSPATLQGPSALQVGDPNANQQQGAPIGGQESGQQKSLWDQLASVLGVTPANAAEASQSGSQNTLTQGDIQSAPFLGPWSGTDTGTGKQLGAPYTPEPTGARVTEGTWAGNDPQAGTEAAPLGGAPAPTSQAPGAGWFRPDTSGNLGGEAAPLGGASPFGAEYGPFAGGAGPGAITPIPGGLDYSQPAPNAPPGSNETVPDTFASRFGSFQPPSSGGPLSTTGDITGLGYGPQSQNNISTVAETSPAGTDFSPNALNAPPGSFQFSGNFGPGNRFTVPGTTAATTTPPVSGSPEDSDLADPSQTDPNQTVQQTLADLTTNTPTPRPDPRNLLSTPIGSGVGNIMSNLPADTSGIPLPTPDPRNAPTTFADRFSPFDTSNVPLPRAAPGQVGGGGPGGAPAQAAPGGTPAQNAPAGTAGPGDYAQAGGGYDPQRGQFQRGRRYPPGSVAGTISDLFGGGNLGDTVSSLMLQLGVPAALIFAATRGGGGGRLGLVGGRGAMGGAGQGLFRPQLSSAPLFPGAGLAGLAGLGIAGAMAGNKLANPTQPNQSQPPQSSGTAPGPQAPRTPAADEAPLTGFTTPRGGNMPMPRPQFTPNPLQTAQAGAQNGAIGYINQRGGHTAGVGAPQLNPVFASRVAAAAQAYEAETGRPARFGETGRSYAQQAEYYANWQQGRGGLAAPPGYSRHEKGLAIDINEPNFQAWMHRNAARFGLQGLRDPRDPDHFQMAST